MTPYAQTHWNLDALIPSTAPAEIDKALKSYQKKVKKVEAWRKNLRPAIAVKAFLALLSDYESMARDGNILYSFAGLRFAADTQDQAALAFMSQIDQLMAEANNRVLFVSLWWKHLDDRNANRLLKASGGMRYWLEEMRHFKPHTLSEPEEKIINLKNVNGSSALQTLFDTITSKFTFTLKVDGRKKTLTEDGLMAYVRDHRAEVREAAYRERLRPYAENATVLAQIYANLMRDWHSENVQLRKFKSPIAARNLGNDIPDPVVETLLKVITRNSHVFQRYFKLKARWIGQEKLRRYDLYAPLARSDKQFAYNDAVQLVIDTFSGFSPRMGALAKQVFDDDHVDSEIRKGKRGGAFCWAASPGMSPFVLLNYTGRPRDVAIVAHEIGHAIHALLAADHSVLTFHSSLPMAETASVFSEMLLTEQMLAKETDPAVKRDLLAGAIDDTYATVGRQGFFSIWEKEAHAMVAQGRTADEMAARYMEHLRMQFGDSVDITEDFKWEWVLIPHFYSSPFYVYAYAFGQLMVLSLFEMYKKEREKFKPKYLKILSYGGSESPTKVLKEAGIDIQSAKFWQGGFDVIARMIDDLEKMYPPAASRPSPSKGTINK